MSQKAHWVEEADWMDLFEVLDVIKRAHPSFEVLRDNRDDGVVSGCVKVYVLPTEILDVVMRFAPQYVPDMTTGMNADGDLFIEIPYAWRPAVNE